MDKEMAIRVMSEDTSAEAVKEIEKSADYNYFDTVNIIQDALDIGVEAIKRTCIKDCEGCYYKKYCQIREVEDIDYCSKYEPR